MSGEIAVRPAARKSIGFRLLGTFEMTVEGHPQKLGPEQQQRMLVPLLGAGGTPVTQQRLMDAIWDDQLPKEPREDLWHLAHDVRKRLKEAGWTDVLIAANGAYRLAIPPDCVDVHRFHTLVADARQIVGVDDTRAVGLLEEAMRLHRGEPLAGLRGHWVDNYRHALVEECHAAQLALYEVAIRRGEFGHQLPGLQTLYRERPDDEWVAWLLMHALYRAGRQGEALDVRREVASHLDRTIAAETLKALAELYDRILRHDDDLLRPEALSFPAGIAGARARALGRPGPRATQGSWSGERGKGRTAGPEGYEDAMADEEETAPQDQAPAAEEPGTGSREDTGRQPQVGIVINGNAQVSHGGVIGTQINYGGAR